jgi:hypothetical protein
MRTAFTVMFLLYPIPTHLEFTFPLAAPKFAFAKKKR